MGRIGYSSPIGEMTMAAIALRLVLVFVTLLAQLPCGASAGRVRPMTGPEAPAATERNCECCQHGQSRSPNSPAPPEREQSPTLPDQSTHCLCPLCSPGFVPLTSAVRSRPSSEEPEALLTPPSSVHAQSGHRPPLDRPPRLAD